MLSFPNENFFKNKERLLGEIFLSYETCKKESKRFKMKNKDRIGHLIVHGTLHLLGYDHKTKLDKKKMINIDIKINIIDLMLTCLKLLVFRKRRTGKINMYNPNK